MTSLYSLYDFINYIERAKEHQDLQSKKDNLDKSALASSTPTKSSTQPPTTSQQQHPQLSTPTKPSPPITTSHHQQQQVSPTTSNLNNFKFRYQEPTHSFLPDVDIYENKDTLYVEIEAVGIEKNDIKIDWDSNTSKLIISGNRKKNQSLNNNNNNNNYNGFKVLLNEIEHGVFKREIKLNSNLLDLSSINATLVNGVLLIKISKTPKDKLNIKVNIQ